MKLWPFYWCWTTVLCKHSKLLIENSRGGTACHSWTANIWDLDFRWRLMKYFWAWLATCDGVLVTTQYLEMLFQSPFPYFSGPSKNNLLITNSNKQTISIRKIARSSTKMKKCCLISERVFLGIFQAMCWNKWSRDRKSCPPPYSTCSFVVDSHGILVVMRK